MKQAQSSNDPRLEARRARAAARNIAHAQLTPAQKLAKLDARLGVGAGAFRERARLRAAMRRGQQAVAAEAATALFEGKDSSKKKGERKQKGWKSKK